MKTYSASDLQKAFSLFPVSSVLLHSKCVQLVASTASWTTRRRRPGTSPRRGRRGKHLQQSTCFFKTWKRRWGKNLHLHKNDISEVAIRWCRATLRRVILPRQDQGYIFNWKEKGGWNISLDKMHGSFHLFLHQSSHIVFHFFLLFSSQITFELVIISY